MVIVVRADSECSREVSLTSSSSLSFIAISQCARAKMIAWAVVPFFPSFPPSIPLFPAQSAASAKLIPSCHAMPMPPENRVKIEELQDICSTFTDVGSLQTSDMIGNF